MIQHPRYPPLPKGVLRGPSGWLAGNPFITPCHHTLQGKQKRNKGVMKKGKVYLIEYEQEKATMEKKKERKSVYLVTSWMALAR